MTLQNKLGITSSPELAQAEERISKKKALAMFESGLLDTLEAGSVSSLLKIHQELFGDIYDFAGKIRDVNIAKGNFRFAPVMYLHAALENIEKMPQNTFDQAIEKYVEMNIAHPFREGNGRATRIWLDLILKKELGKVIDWSKVDKEDYLELINLVPGTIGGRWQLEYARLFRRITDNSKMLAVTGLKQSDFMTLYDALKMMIAAVPEGYEWPDTPTDERMDKYLEEHGL